MTLASELRGAETRLLRALSGPSGKTVGAQFVLDEIRSRFVYPQDREVIVYFEWDAPPGDHALTGIWKDPNGTPTSISQDIRMQTTTRQMNLSLHKRRFFQLSSRFTVRYCRPLCSSINLRAEEDASTPAQDS